MLIDSKVQILAALSQVHGHSIERLEVVAATVPAVWTVLNLLQELQKSMCSWHCVRLVGTNVHSTYNQHTFLLSIRAGLTCPGVLAIPIV